jgi:hypothetical protein
LNKEVEYGRQRDYRGDGTAGCGESRWSRHAEKAPECGQEMASEGEALIEAFRTGQPFYTLTAWKAVPEVNGGNPVIVKQAAAQKTI